MADQEAKVSVLRNDDRALRFVDAHVHFWDLAHLRYDWLSPPFTDAGPNGDVRSIARTYLPADYCGETAGWAVAGVVHVEAGARPDQAVAETAWLTRLGEGCGLPSAIVAFADLAAVDVAAVLEAHASHPRVRGVRQIVNWHVDSDRTYTQRDITRDEAWRRGFALLARYGLSFDLQCYPAQVQGLVPLFARHPDVPVLVNHMGMPVPSDVDGLVAWRHAMRALAALPHIAIKLSGPGFIWRDWTEDRVRPLILEAIDIFGAERAMFASDWPTDSLFGTLDAHLNAYHAIVKAFSYDERRALFAANASRLYRLAPHSETRP